MTSRAKLLLRTIEVLYSFRTYPNSDESGQQLLHEVCLELETEEKIKRSIDGDYILWKPIRVADDM